MDLMKLQVHLDNPHYLRAVEILGSYEDFEHTYRRMYGEPTTDPELEEFRSQNVIDAVLLERQHGQ